MQKREAVLVAIILAIALYQSNRRPSTPSSSSGAVHQRQTDKVTFRAGIDPTLLRAEQRIAMLTLPRTPRTTCTLTMTR